MNLTERFSQLTRMQPDFVLAKTLETTNKPGAWIELSKIKEPIDNFTHRQQLDNELIIEIDASNMEESKKVYEQIKPKLKELWLNWD